MTSTLQAWYTRHKRLTWIIAAMAILYTIAGFVITPLIIHHLVATKATQAIGRTVDVDRVKTNPFTFTLQLDGLSIAEKTDGRFLEVGMLHVNLQPLASLFKWGLVLKSASIQSPSVQLKRNGPDQFNFTDIITKTASGNAADAQTAEPLRIVLHHFTLEDGQVAFTDDFAAGFQTRISAVSVSLDGLDTQAEAPAAQFQLSARTESEESVAIDGTVSPAPLDIRATAAIKQLQIGKYSPYYASQINATIDRGALSVNATLNWRDAVQTITDLRCTINQLLISPIDSTEPIISIPETALAGGRIDLQKQQIDLTRISTEGGRIHAVRSKAGDINLAKAFTPPGNAALETEAKASPDTNPRTKQAPQWQMAIGQLDLANYTVQFEDDAVSPMAKLHASEIALSVSSLSNREGAMADSTLRLNWAEQGKLTVEGKFGFAPLHATLAITAKALDVRPIQPYINDHVKLVVTQGNFETHGQLDLVPQADTLDLRYAGKAALNNVQSVDPAQEGAFLNWKSLYVDGLALSTAPLDLVIEEVSLTDFYNRLIIFENGSSNLAAILAGSKDASAPPSSSAQKSSDTAADTPKPTIRVNTVTLQGGSIDFSDRYIKPSVQLPMTQLGGRISGLDTIQSHRAEVLLEGMVNKTVPLEIKGKINPLIEKPYVDLKLDFAGVDLSPFTPYSGKYLGYTLDKGQLSLNLSYQVADNKLSGENKVLLNQLTLGEPVPSETATKLPIKFAIALLKDGSGNIDLDLPVTGDLDDPEFSIGGIILKMFVNLIVNIVTSPFKVLGAMIGGGEELAHLDFDAGQATLSDSGPEKLDALAKILTERPGLKLEIQGQVAPEQDRNGLRRLRFDETLKHAKLKADMAGGKPAVPLDQIELTPETRETLIADAFKAAEFPKPRDAAGKLKALKPREMEKLLYTAIVLTEDDLRLLAHQRANAAKTYLLQTAGIAAERIFVVEPKIRPEKGDDPMHSRVQFNLK